VRITGFVITLVMLASAMAASLKKETVQAFDRYIRTTEAKLEQQRNSGQFLWVDSSPERVKLARQGQVVIEPLVGKGDTDVPGGLVHDWIGAAFIPGATLQQTLNWVQDYDAHKKAYRPEVLDSRLLSHNGNDYKIYMRVTKKKVITVVLDTEHEVHYGQIDAARAYSKSYSTKIAEVEDPGTSSEKVLPPGEGHGFLWRLDSYWKFQERDGGVYIECQAISLTRSVPAGLGWLVEPIVRQLPRQSLENTLRSTRDAVMARRPKQLTM